MIAHSIACPVHALLSCFHLHSFYDLHASLIYNRLTRLHIRFCTASEPGSSLCSSLETVSHREQVRSANTMPCTVFFNSIPSPSFLLPFSLHLLTCIFSLLSLPPPLPSVFLVPAASSSSLHDLFFCLLVLTSYSFSVALNLSWNLLSFAPKAIW